MRFGLSARLYRIIELKTSSLKNEVSDCISEGGSAVHEEEESGIAFVGK